MSLNKAQWEAMWESIKIIETHTIILRTTNPIRSQKILDEIEFIRKQIQSVIGQKDD